MRPLAVGALAWAALAVPAAANAQGSLEVVTVPKLKGAPFVVNGQTYRSDGYGVAHLPASAARVGFKPKALDFTLRGGIEARFARWYGSATSGRIRATYDTYYRVRPEFVDLKRAHVDPKLVSSAVVRSSIGVRYRFDGARSKWLQGGRVVPLNGSLEPKDIYYTFEQVEVDGANVVNEGQQKFFPVEAAARSGPGPALVRVELLFYHARFRGRDAFFGFSIGKSVRLTWPSGRVQHYALGDDGEVFIPSLPRGDYKVALEGPGLSLGGPVSLSRNQDVEVAMLSYVDLAVVAFVLLAFAVGLPLLRRRHFLTSLRLRARRALANNGRQP